MEKLALERLLTCGVELHFFEVTDSTNACAKKSAEEAARSGNKAPRLFVAREQSAGRGRMGRSFYSPDGTGLYLSLAIRAEETLADAVFLTTASAVAVFRAIRTVTGIETEIKWVNDLYYRDRKVSGILAESFVTDQGRFIVLGVGVNLSTKEFPEELRDRAGSLFFDADGTKNRLAAEVIRELLAVLSPRSDRDALMELYRDHSMVLGKAITYVPNIESQDRQEGVAVGIDDRGALLVEMRDGSLTRLTSGEITLRLKD